MAKAFVDLGTKHYPERMQKFWIVGAPAIFSVLWNAIIPFVDDVTRSKIVMLPCAAYVVLSLLQLLLGR